MEISKRNNLALLITNQSANNVNVVIDIMNNRIEYLNEKRESKEQYGFFTFDKEYYINTIGLTYSDLDEMENVKKILSSMNFGDKTMKEYIEKYEEGELSEDIKCIIEDYLNLLNLIMEYIHETIKVITNF